MVDVSTDLPYSREMWSGNFNWIDLVCTQCFTTAQSCVSNGGGVWSNAVTMVSSNTTSCSAAGIGPGAACTSCFSHPVPEHSPPPVAAAGGTGKQSRVVAGDHVFKLFLQDGLVSDVPRLLEMMPWDTSNYNQPACVGVQ